MTLKERFKNWVMGWQDATPQPTPNEVTNLPISPPIPVPEESIEPAPEDSTEPWVSIESTSYDPVKGFRIELNWNAAFVQHLRESGITGRTDDEIVHKWVALLYKDLVERMEQDALEKSDIIQPSEFV